MAHEAKNEGKAQMQKAGPAKALSPFEEMDRLFDAYFSRGWLHPFQWSSLSKAAAPFEGRMPNVDLIDRENEFVIKAELPGVDKKDLDISVTQNSVTIKGSTRHEEKEEKGDYHRCEISRGSYARSMSLPSDVDEEHTKATFKDGILELTLPKLKKSKRHTVKVD
jgi:HSP20 family protein